MAIINNLTDIWNNAGTVFTAVKMSITDTASQAGSKLLDLVVGGNSVFSVDKTGAVVSTKNGPVAYGVFVGGSTIGIGRNSSTAGLNLFGTNSASDGVASANLTDTALKFQSGNIVQWTSTADVNGTIDIGLSRNTAGVLEINNGVAGTFRDLKARNITANTRITAGDVNINGAGNIIIQAGTASTRILNSAASMWTPLSASFLGLQTGVFFGSTIPETGGFDAGIARSAASLIEINNGTVGTYADAKARSYLVDATNTASGTTGAQTINKAAGTVNFAAAGTTLVVTNSLVTANSLVFCTIRTNDSTAIIKNVTPASGSFTIRLNAAATAETSVGFYVIN